MIVTLSLFEPPGWVFCRYHDSTAEHFRAGIHVVGVEGSTVVHLSTWLTH